MKKKIDTIKPKKAQCNNCIFCFSKCLNCGVSDITVEYRDIWCYRYRNRFMDHIYVTKLKKKILKKPPLLKIDCNKCKNKIIAIGESDRHRNSQYLYSYNRNNPSKYFRSNSKYNKQAKYLFETMAEDYMMPTSAKSGKNCDSFHLFVDGTEAKDGKGICINIEWFLYYGEDIILTTNNFSYKNNPGRLRFMMILESDKMFYANGKIQPKLTGLELQ